MKRETIGIHTVVEAKLTSFGAHVLAAYIDAETERATGQPNPKREGQSQPPRREVEMPLWELIKVFGPHLVSSTRQAFDELCFVRVESKEERAYRDAERGQQRAIEDLADLAKAVGVASGFVAPELVVHRARQFAAAIPHRVPNEAGYWWLGSEVVKVSSENGALTARINGRRRAVSNEQPWRGQAIVDARVPKVENDEDIPF
jgi:hypothetical protein